MPQVTQRGSVDYGDAVAKSAVRLTRINDAKAFEDEESVTPAIYFHVAKDLRPGRFCLQTRRSKGGAKHLASLILDAIRRILSNPNSPHVKHHVVGFIFRILNRAH